MGRMCSCMMRNYLSICSACGAAFQGQFATGDKQTNKITSTVNWTVKKKLQLPLLPHKIWRNSNFSTDIYNSVQEQYLSRPCWKRLEATCHTQHHKHNHRAQSWHVWNKTPTSSHPLHPLALSACDIDVCRLKSIQPRHPRAGMSSLSSDANEQYTFLGDSTQKRHILPRFCQLLGVILREACTFATLLFGNGGNMLATSNEPNIHFQPIPQRNGIELYSECFDLVAWILNIPAMKLAPQKCIQPDVRRLAGSTDSLDGEACLCRRMFSLTHGKLWLFYCWLNILLRRCTFLDILNMLEGKEHRLKIKVHNFFDLVESYQTAWNHWFFFFFSPQDEDKLNKWRSGSSSLPGARDARTTCVYIFDWIAVKCCVIKSIWRAPFNLGFSRGLTSSSRLRICLISGMETQIQYGPLLLQIAFRHNSCRWQISKQYALPPPSERWQEYKAD